MGGVCATCLKERLSKLSSLCSKSRQPSTLPAPPLKELLEGTADFCHEFESAPKMSLELTIEPQDTAEARQSIAYLIERDIVEAHRRYSDAASRVCHVPSDNQLLRCKSTSQLDGYSRFNGKYLRSISSHQQTQSGGKHVKINIGKESMASSTRTDYHDLQRGTTPSPQCQHNRGKLTRFELQSKKYLPHLTKSKSTGGILNRPQMRDHNKWSERWSPIDLLLWNKKRKTLSMSSASLEDSAPLMMTSCSMKKTKDMMRRPMKIHLRWRVMPRKSLFGPSTASSGTPQSTSSSSRSWPQSEQKHCCDVPLPPKLDNPVEPERVMCGHWLRRLLSQVRGHNTFTSGLMSSAEENMDVDASVEKTICCPREVVASSRDWSQQFNKMQQHMMLYDDVKASALEQGNRRQGGGEVAKGSPGNEVSNSSKSPSRAMKADNALGVSLSTSSSLRESSTGSVLSFISSPSPSLTSSSETSMTYTNLQAKPDTTIVLNSMALISKDVSEDRHISS
ncbi:hypothetical protein L7F22_029544 [Adiantum nelumboides]|nr:hypothetical protein [Adiantum nelumboides]